MKNKLPKKLITILNDILEHKQDDTYVFEKDELKTIKKALRKDKKKRKKEISKTPTFIEWINTPEYIYCEDNGSYSFKYKGAEYFSSELPFKITSTKEQLNNGIIKIELIPIKT